METLINISLPKYLLDSVMQLADEEGLKLGYLIKRSIRRYQNKPFKLADIPNTDVATLTIRMPESLNTLLNQLALDNDLTKSQVVSQIVNQYL